MRSLRPTAEGEACRRSRLEEQLGLALEGEAWHGPSVLEVLEGVSAEQAAAHLTAGAHSIWELVLHLCGTYGLVLRRLGGDGRQLTEPEDWPSVPEPSAQNWSDSIRVLKRLNEDLGRAVRNLSVWTSHWSPRLPTLPIRSSSAERRTISIMLAKWHS